VTVVSGGRVLRKRSSKKSKPVEDSLSSNQKAWKKMREGKRKKHRQKTGCTSWLERSARLSVGG